MHVVDTHYEMHPFDSWCGTKHIQPHEATGLPPLKPEDELMSNRFNARSVAVLLALATLGAAPALAAEPAAVYGAKTVGAMALESSGRPTNGTMVRRQGGFVTAGAVRWIKTPVATMEASASAF
jgi:hypothetical protein